MPVREIDPGDKRELNRFVRLERELATDDRLFYCDLDSNVRKYLTRESEFSKDWDLGLFANERARAVAIVSPVWQLSQDAPQTGGIGWFAAAPDSIAETGEGLEAAEEFLRR